DNDERRSAELTSRKIEGTENLLLLIRIAYVKNIPAETEEARCDVLGEGKFGMPLDRHAIGVIDPAELVKSEMAGQRRGLVGNSLHHAAVAAERVGTPVDDRVVRAVEVGGEPALGHGKADAHGNALPQGSGRRLHAGGEVVLGVSRAGAAELA